MSELSDTLRLQTARFNNFLIENYLVKANLQNNKNEPLSYLFNSFFNLSEHLAAVGSSLGSLPNLQPGNIVPLKEAIGEAVKVVYLIDNAAGIDELTSNIKGINTANLVSNIKNINAYGKEFDKGQVEIDAEIDDLKRDNDIYFNNDGTLKFDTYEISLDEAIGYLSNHSAILQVKNAFKKITDTYHYFSSIISGSNKSASNYTSDKIFIGNLLTTLTVILIALGYIEPFFEKPHDVARVFEQHIKDISATQSSILNDLS